MLCRIRAYGYQGGEGTGDKWRKHSLGYFFCYYNYYPPTLSMSSKKPRLFAVFDAITSPRKFHRNLRLCYAASEPMAIKAAKVRGTSGESIAWIILIFFISITLRRWTYSQKAQLFAALRI